MGLREYKSKRKFGRTPEPEPGPRTAEDRLVFVVHKHAARALHYDLRLELDGVLKSWAVPKGPPPDPKVKRLAVMVEDHPFDYKDFEGVIPAGNYGAGSVIIWDRGFYRHPAAAGREENERLLRQGLRKGDLKFVLEGQKLRGEFALVKTRKDDRSWLLLRKGEPAADEEIPGDNRSVASGKTLEEISSAAGLRSGSTAEVARIRLREALEGKDLADAPAAALSHRMRPMLASLAGEPFDHPDWLFEVKWDGYRAVAEVDAGNALLYSRSGVLMNEKFGPVVRALKNIGFQAVLDGEVVVLNDEGEPDFQMLQNYRKTGEGHLVYYVFDLLYLQGHDLTGLPLLRRKDLLRRVLPPGPVVKFSDHVAKDGVLFFGAARRKGLEGMVAKHSRSPYLPGRRSKQWLKVKTRLTQEGVIAGFTEPQGRRRDFGSLVLGVYEGGRLSYIGQSGGGFTGRGLAEMRHRLDPLIRKTCPFAAVPDVGSPATWVRPVLVCEVAFQGWTDEGLMRQPVFLRLREDKSAREVVREGAHNP